MDPAPAPPYRMRFGAFEVDLKAGELLADGTKIRLQEKPYQILRLLLQQPGEIITREEIQKRLWSGNTFVEFEHSINAAVKRLRKALGDSAEHPRYIETVGYRGYRFIAPVKVVALAERTPSQATSQDAGRVPAIQEVGAASARLREYRALPYSRWVAVTLSGIVLIGVILIVLNVAGLGVRLSKAVRAGLVLVQGQPQGSPLQIQSIAVLPLENLSRDPEQEYFADGMTEELITYLGRVSSLRVISRTSVMQYRGAKKPLPQIARELNVDALVEGAVLRSGSRVRITAQLIQANPEKHLWANSYERDVRDVLALQSEVAQRVIQEIKITLTPQERSRLASARELNPEAYMLYVQGKFYLNKLTPEDQKKGLNYLQQAVEKDPTSPLPYAGLALAYSLVAHYGDSGAYRRANAAANKALELEPNLAEAHEALAEAKLYNHYDPAGAEQEFKRVLTLNDNIPEAHAHYGWYLQLKGRTEEAIIEMRRAQELSPLDPVFAGWLGQHYEQAGRYDEAMAQVRKTLELNPNFPWGHSLLAQVYLDKGMNKEAIEEDRKAAEASPELRWCLGLTLANTGHKEEARKIADALRKQPSPFDMWGLAAIYSVLGEKDEALRWLEAAYRARFSWMLWIRPPAYRWSPFSPLYGEPRFRKLQEQLKVL